MSAIGPTGMGGVHLAGSVAGLQNSGSNQDRARAESADRSFQISRDAMQVRATEDVSEAELSSDRDADGRMSWNEEDARDEPAAEETAARKATTGGSDTSSTHHRAPDAFGESGTRLDLEA